MKRDELPICGWCDEPVAEVFQWIPHMMPSGPTKLPYHRECLIRSIIGGLHHQMGVCTCCPGGTLPPDPPQLSKHDAARAAFRYFTEREEALCKVAREVCHAFGMPWTDPRTGETHKP